MESFFLNRERTLMKKILLYALLAFVVCTVLPVLFLRWISPPTSAFMVESWMSNMLSGKNQPTQYHWVTWDRISPWMGLAAMASEDQKFPFHHGFDFESISDAVHKHEEGGRLRGASTISQQVAKNLFLWPGRNLVRKGIEAYFTVLLELFWSKLRILEVYLNIAQFGEGIYGVYAATQTYFHKLPSELTRQEAVLLVTVLPNPKIFNVLHPSPYMEERVSWIESQMKQLGGLAYLGNITGGDKYTKEVWKDSEDEKQQEDKKQREDEQFMVPATENIRDPNTDTDEQGKDEGSLLWMPEWEKKPEASPTAPGF